MKFLAPLSCLAALASAAAVAKRASPLDVKLEMVGNSEVKASITNSGAAALKVLKTGSILDSRPIQKVQVFQGADEVAFNGMRLYVRPSEAAEADFQTIDAGETVEVQWDVAEVHDLSSGGAFDISAAGSLKYATTTSSPVDSTSTTSFGELSYGSNVLTAQIDSAAASAAQAAFLASHEKRTVIQSDCSSTQRSTISSALSVARTYATDASRAAASGSEAKLTEYFKSASSSVRSTVSRVFERIASEASSSTSGASRTYCTDRAAACSGGVIAYTVPASSYVVYCPSWFQLPARTTQCHGDDRPYVVVHESTHLAEIAGTEDYNCYGYDCLRGLPASRNLNHADTYAQFANAIAVGC